MNNNFAQKQVRSSAQGPQALMADDTSVGGVSSIGPSFKTGNTKNALGSFQDPAVEIDPANPMTDSMMESAEYGMPLTEDAENLMPMAQL